ncbi:MAG TPA: tetratricopeptide repeat protein [Candidatus Dormibacteraeota bacterium]|nr:tetratricopeptide repeat protein [Candidatus Dormibacteraeota bacterium]
MSEVPDDLRGAAAELFERAYELQMAGELDTALELYTRSIELHATAEAYTFRGWTHGCRGELEEAIADCHRAIETDPEFGNPYNDIGAYLIQMGRLDEAEPWLLQATTAPRYEARAYPWANLARIDESRGRWSAALDHYRRALAENAAYPVAVQGIARMRARLN